MSRKPAFFFYSYGFDVDLRQTFLEASDGGRTQSLISLESLHWPMLSLAQSGVSYPIILDCYRMILSDKEKEGDMDGR